ncbi:MAG: FRG domain-containing protein [Bacteroidetes bacterium]|nr:FRG domain-containing protein [Bacteroidota bacterium]
MTEPPKYNNFEEKKAYFEIIKINDFETLWDKLGKINFEAIYRGVSSSLYKIFSSQHRFIIENDLSNDNNELLITRELFKHVLKLSYLNDLFCETQRTVGNIRLDSTINDTTSVSHKTIKLKYTFFLFSILQHYKAIAPLVDFTSNFQKALFFATDNVNESTYSDENNIKNYVSVYILNKGRIIKNKVNKSAHGKLTNPQRLKWMIEAWFKDAIELADSFFIDNCHYINDELHLFEDDEFIENINLIVQEGKFIFYKLNGKRSLEEVYKKAYGDKILSFEIHKKLIPEIILSLTEKKITHNTMYPDMQMDVKKCFEDSKNAILSSELNINNTIPL